MWSFSVSMRQNGTSEHLASLFNNKKDHSQKISSIPFNDSMPNRNSRTSKFVCVHVYESMHMYMSIHAFE